MFTCYINDSRFIIKSRVLINTKHACKMQLSLFCVCKQVPCESALRLLLEAQIREEVSAEFLELFNKMEKDYR